MLPLSAAMRACMRARVCGWGGGGGGGVHGFSSTSHSQGTLRVARLGMVWGGQQLQLGLHNISTRGRE